MEKTQREKKELEFFLNMDQGKKVSIVLEGISLANEVTVMSTFFQSNPFATCIELVTKSRERSQ